MNIKCKYGFFLTIAAVVFFSINSAHATTVLEQPDYSSTHAQTNGSNITQDLGSAVSGDINQITIYAAFGTNTTTTIGLTKNGVGGATFTATQRPTNGVPTFVTYTLNGGGVYTLTNGDHFVLTFNDIAGTTDAIIYGTTDSGYYTGGNCSGSSGCSPLTDVYFKIEDTTASTLSLNNIIANLDYSDFLNWDIDVASPDLFGSRIDVVYHMASSTTVYTDSYTVGIPYLPTISELPNLLITKTNSLWYPPLAIPTSWVVQLFQYDADNNLIQNTDPIPFTVTPTSDYTFSATSTSGYISPTSTDQFRYDNIDCSGFGDLTFQNFGCQLRKAGTWIVQLLFVPTKGLDAMANVYNSFKQVFPFSIFYNLTDTFKAHIANPSSTPATALEYNWETPRLLSAGGGIIYASSSDTITFSNSTTLSSLLGDSTVAMIFNAILLIAIMVMMYVIYRLIFHKAH